MHFAISSNVASVWCVNGRTVSGDCERVIDDALSKRLTLQKGPNTVNCARVKKRQITELCARSLGSGENPRCISATLSQRQRGSTRQADSFPA
jgi:hypothetical protein